MHYPKELSIELTDMCTLRCELCDNKNIQRPRGFMDLDKFKKLIDEVSAHTKSINFGVSGEPLLHPQADAFITYAKAKGMHTSMTTNATLLKAWANRLIAAGLDDIVLSLDGMTRETYESYRKGPVAGIDHFTPAKEGIQTLCAQRHAMRHEKPHITISFMVHRHNEHEIEAVKEWSKAIKADQLLLKSMHFNWAGNDQQVKSEWAPQNKEFVRHYDYTRLGTCAWVNDNTVIFWNGELASCCYDLLGKTTFGNVFQKGFKDVWESPEHRRVQPQMAARTLPQCIGCSAGVKLGTYIDNRSLITKIMQRAKE
ncbi:MAG: radical SAM protein [Candidatus Iainarchaeum archaeon]|uniref:Radical SAM protein n=1 Tax=Candidatus Iainarchaeum sp. TaxID=3101447 RepID=A0A7T9DK04_9ARCH|nr:MAG: radical SAM protein [Candidatus Diapherotrites archaeon]